MNQSMLAFAVLLSPLVFALTALISWFQSGIHPTWVKKVATSSSVLSIVIAASSGFFVARYGSIESPLLGMAQLGLSIRLDSISVLMLGMIALIGFIVIRFSLNYLEGDLRHGAFIGRLAATIASVQLLVLSGNLAILLVAWVLTSMSLHRLLVFYPERPGAIIAARKKYLVARLGDLCLLIAFGLMVNQFGTGNLEIIFQEIRSALSSGASNFSVEPIAILLVIAALLKSAQFPSHGWLVEVMETPTPVSALLHAGLLNAGPFLIIRMSFLMEASQYAPLILLGIGGFTALFASVVFLTQTSIKTALGYSSVAHMGFSLMTCGLGLYPAAMLHLVAHSFYKAHAFLSSGSVIEVIRASKITPSHRIGSPIRIGLGILLALGSYAGIALLWGIDPKNQLALFALGGIMVLGLARIFTTALDSNGGFRLLIQAMLISVGVTLAFFTLESGSHYLISSQIPEVANPSWIEILLFSLVLLAFGATVFLQVIAPRLKANPMFLALSIHLKNGLYANAVFDRMVRSLYAQQPKSKPIVVSKQKEGIALTYSLTENQPA